MTITAQDVETRYLEAVDKFYEISNISPYPPISSSDIEWNQRRSEMLSWWKVVNQVRDGGDPLLCVLERE